MNKALEHFGLCIPEDSKHYMTLSHVRRVRMNSDDTPIYKFFNLWTYSKQWSGELYFDKGLLCD